MRLHILLVAIAICLALPAGAQTAPMDCTVGPVIKTFGGLEISGQQLLRRAHGGSHGHERQSAFPCFIKIEPLTEGYNINGRGKGDKQATNAAMNELAALSVADIEGMIDETKQLQKLK